MPKRTIRSRTAKQSREDEADATHVVEVTVEGVGLSMDQAIFEAAGQYSDHSGFGLGARDHGFYVRGLEAAKAIESKLETALAGVKHTIDITQKG